MACAAAGARAWRLAEGRRASSRVPAAPASSSPSCLRFLAASAVIFVGELLPALFPLGDIAAAGAHVGDGDGQRGQPEAARLAAASVFIS